MRIQKILTHQMQHAGDWIICWSGTSTYCEVGTVQCPWVGEIQSLEEETDTLDMGGHAVLGILCEKQTNFSTGYDNRQSIGRSPEIQSKYGVVNKG